MASTNKTTNYNLSQYVGSDKPTYLGDYNSDMLKIDTQMKANADNAATANSLATAAKSTADLAEEHAQSANTNATNANTNATNAQNTATQALSKSLENEAKIANLNLSNHESISSNSFNITEGTLVFNNLKASYNNDKSLGKLYGTLLINVTSNANRCVVSFPTPFRPSENLSINGTNLLHFFTSIGLSNVGAETLNINTDGTVSLSFYKEGLSQVRVDLFACLLYLSNFTDQPIPQN